MIPSHIKLAFASPGCTQLVITIHHLSQWSHKYGSKASFGRNQLSWNTFLLGMGDLAFYQLNFLVSSSYFKSQRATKFLPALLFIKSCDSSLELRKVSTLLVIVSI